MHSELFDGGAQLSTCNCVPLDREHKEHKGAHLCKVVQVGSTVRLDISIESDDEICVCDSVDTVHCVRHSTVTQSQDPKSGCVHPMSHIQTWMTCTEYIMRVQSTVYVYIVPVQYTCTRYRVQ